METAISRRIIWITAFAIAMGYFEGAVVVYLREIFYPSGFSFPLVRIGDRIAVVELLREAATIIMLVTAGALAGKSKTQRFAFFLLTFGIWDIVYYATLYFSLGWPSSLAEWDILFLIPVPWVGPVWAPCLLSVVMITGSVIVITKLERSPGLQTRGSHWILAVGGAVICLAAFMADYVRYVSRLHGFKRIFSREAMDSFSHYMPSSFNIVLFSVGVLLMCLSIGFFIIDSKKNEKKHQDHAGGRSGL